MLGHKRSTQDSVVLARDLERTLNATIEHEGRRADRVWLASLAYLVARAIHSLPEVEK